MTPHKNVSLGTHLIRQIVYTHNQLQTSPYPSHTHTPRHKSSPISLTQNAEVETIANLNSFENRLTRLACFCDTCEFPMPAKVFAVSEDGGRPRSFSPPPSWQPFYDLQCSAWFYLKSKMRMIQNTKWKCKTKFSGKTANGKRKRFLIVMAELPCPLCSSTFLDVNWKRDAVCTCRLPQGVCSSCVCVSVCESVCIAHAASK